MGEVISPSEELFNLAVQGLLMLGQSQVQLPTHRMSHDMHASNDVHIESQTATGRKSRLCRAYARPK